ncbi:MAG: tetratricopeptide repeat protein [Acidimicrobiia bacterium]|nr:tetratricopeptide repeat protein [Acidimicrobiia bacterium]
MSRRRRKASHGVDSSPKSASVGPVVPVRRLHHAVVILFLIVGSGLVYANALNHEFVWDDNSQIVRNPFLHADEPLVRLFVTDVWGYTHPDQKGTSNYYRPLQMVTYRLIGQVAGLNATAFHAANLVFHVLATLAGYLVAWQLTRRYWVAFSASVLFALHPIHTEAVVWIAALPELGCCLFFFLSFWLFLRAEESSANAGIVTLQTRTLQLRVSSLLAFAVALLWKEMVLTLPIVIAAYLFAVSHSGEPILIRIVRSLRRVLPYLCVVGGYLTVRYFVLGFISRVQHVWIMSPGEFAMSVIYLAGQYWLKLILPLHLNSFHLFDPVRSLGDSRFLASAVLLCIVVGWIGFAWRRYPVAAFSTAWVFLTLLPVFNIRGVGANVFSERYLYIPSLGFCLLVAWLSSQVLQRQPSHLRLPAGVLALALVSLFYAVWTLRRNRDWKDELSLFTSAVAESPQSAQMRTSLAQALLQKGMSKDAERQYLEAIRVGWERDPADRNQIANAYAGLGGIYVGRGDYQRGLGAVETGLKIGSIEIKGAAYGIALLRVGRIEEGARALHDYHLRNPNDEIVLDALGVIALSRHEYEKAVQYLQRALRIVPDFGSARNNLGRTYLEMGKPQEALPHLQRAAALSPSDPIVQTNLGVAFAALGRPAEARTSLERALALAPNYQPAIAQLQSLRP